MSGTNRRGVPSRAFRLVILAFVAGFAGLPVAGQEKPAKILFVSYDPARKVANIGVMNPDGTGQTNLTKSDDLELDPAWSRDRSRIAFVVANKKTKSGDLYVMNADGTGRKRLTQSPANTVVHAPSWAPDGKRIAFTRRQFDAAGKPLDPELYVIDADGKSLERLGNVPGLLSAWSPDGTKILFASPDKQKPIDTRLYVMAPDGKDVRPLIQGRGILGAWSPDGRKIAYMGRDGDKRAFFLMNADGSGGKVIRHAILDMEVGPAWSLDGKRLYFTGATAGKGLSVAIYVMDADGKNVRRITDPAVPHFLGDGVGIFIPVESPRGAPPPVPNLKK